MFFDFVEMGLGSYVICGEEEVVFWGGRGKKKKNCVSRHEWVTSEKQTKSLFMKLVGG